MGQHVVDGALDTHALLHQASHALSDLIPHLAAQSVLGQAHLGAGPVSACAAAFLLLSPQQVADTAIGAFMVHVVMRMPVGDGEFGGGAFRLTLGNTFLDQGVIGRAIQCQEFLVSTLAHLALFNA